MARLDRDGVGIHYEIHGSGPLLLLSHGYGASADMWAGQIAALAADHTVITWDMRGHGRSDSPEDPTRYGEAHTLGDMQALLDVAGGGPAIVGGLSLGGYMSLAFYRDHPASVRTLMLFDTGPGYRSDEAREKWNRFADRQAEKFETRGLDALARSAETAAAVHRSAAGLAHAARGMLAQRDASVMDTLAGIGVPTLVLVGEDDAPYLAAADYMGSKIPGARKVVLPGAGHAANLDAPQAFDDAVRGFLDGLDDRSVH